jgi:hypothetical protein
LHISFLYSLSSYFRLLQFANLSEGFKSFI